MFLVCQQYGTCSVEEPPRPSRCRKRYYSIHYISVVPRLTLHYTYFSVPLPLFQALGFWEFELNSMMVLNQLYFKVQVMY